MSRRMGLNRPPQIRSNIVVNHRFRFVASDDVVAEQVIVSDIIGSIGNSAASATQLYAVAESFRIKRLSIWGPPAAQGSVSTVSVDWTAANQLFNPNMEVSDTTNSVATPAYISSRPPRNSAAAFWQPSSNPDSGMFTLSCGAGSILDLELEFILYDEVTASTSYTVVGATPGVLYYLALDRSTGNVLTPVSLTTIA